MEKVAINRALISVSDKTGLEALLETLQAFDVALVSTGGTHRAIAAAGYEVQEISDFTQFPEMMEGRVKTLHPKVHGGLLGRGGIDSAVMAAQEIPAIDLLIVNLYPFEAVTQQADCSLERAIENIDIGGPAMIRSAAKNFDRVTVVTDLGDYSALIDELQTCGGGTSRAFRFGCARQALRALRSMTLRSPIICPRVRPNLPIITLRSFLQSCRSNGSKFRICATERTLIKTQRFTEKRRPLPEVCQTLRNYKVRRCPLIILLMRMLRLPVFVAFRSPLV